MKVAANAVGNLRGAPNNVERCGYTSFSPMTNNSRGRIDIVGRQKQDGQGNGEKDVIALALRGKLEPEERPWISVRSRAGDGSR
jgi:hypothetical protein